MEGPPCVIAYLRAGNPNCYQNRDVTLQKLGDVYRIWHIDIRLVVNQRRDK